LSIFVVVRSLTPKQVEALRLRVQGLSTKEIAEKLGSSQRTIERWQLLPEFCEVFERSTQSLVSQLSEDWLAQAQTTSESHTNAHQLAINLALNGLKKIKQKLDDSDCDIEQIDIRRLNWLSMILDRHIQGQRISLSLDYLDLNRCGQRLSQAGYIVLDPLCESQNSQDENEDEDER
jgi:hypothetical protein